MGFIKAIRNGAKFRFNDDEKWYDFIAITFSSPVNGVPIVHYSYWDNEKDKQIFGSREGVDLSELITE